MTDIHIMSGDEADDVASEVNRLRTENERLRADVEKWNTAYLKSIKIGIDQACGSGSRIGQLSKWNEEFQAEIKSLREAIKPLAYADIIPFTIAEQFRMHAILVTPEQITRAKELVEVTLEKER